MTVAIALPAAPLVAYLVIGGLVGLESSGIPLPGETALFAGSLLAHSGRLEIATVIAVAAAAAIIGDNGGYLLGRKLGRRVLERPGRFEKHRRTALERGERFFEAHGAKAVFLGRWVAGLRVWASWLAGMTHLPWRTFLLWNALGGIAWATTVGLAGYFAGRAAEQFVQRAGIGAAIVVAVSVALTFAVVKLRRRQRRRAAGD
jgi:membrane protein DedA with SNARE-associated domain